MYDDDDGIEFGECMRADIIPATMGITMSMHLVPAFNQSQELGNTIAGSWDYSVEYDTSSCLDINIQFPRIMKSLNAYRRALDKRSLAHYKGQ